MRVRYFLLLSVALVCSCSLKQPLNYSQLSDWRNSLSNSNPQQIELLIQEMDTVFEQADPKIKISTNESILAQYYLLRGDATFELGDISESEYAYSSVAEYGSKFHPILADRVSRMLEIYIKNSDFDAAFTLLKKWEFVDPPRMISLRDETHKKFLSHLNH